MRRAHLTPGRAPATWQVRIPGSKSLTNRALLLAAVADGTSTLHAPLVADDTEVMIGAIRELGAEASVSTLGLDVGGLGGPPAGDHTIWCGMAGTVARFLLPVLAAGHGTFTLDAHPQLAGRPLGPMLDALRVQGAATSADQLPLTLTAAGLSGGDVDVDAHVSGQFLSGLLIAAPLAASPTRIRFGAVASWPYIELTLATMRAFGVQPSVAAHEILVAPAAYRAADLPIEPDASTASYFLAAAAVTGTTVTIPGLDRRTSLQGDLALAGILGQMGATVTDMDSGLSLTGPARLRGVHVDMRDCTDVAMTLACVAPFADGPTTIGGLANVRVKESDRLAATAENLRRLGIAVQEGPDSLRIEPGTPRAATLPTYDDHRIAMAFAVIGLRTPVTLEDPGVVAKTCPTFFDLWRATGARVALGDGR